MLMIDELAGLREQPTTGKKFRRMVASGPQIGYDGTMTFNQASDKRFGHECPASLLQDAWIRMAAGG